METLLFIIVFGLQIVLINYVIASRLLRNISFVLDKHPESEYPRLYPLGSQHLQNSFRFFRNANRGLIAIGVLLIVYVVFLTLNNPENLGIYFPWAGTGEWDAAIVMPFFFLQYLPLVFLEISQGKSLAMMRCLAKKSVKTASLTKRKLTEIISVNSLLLWTLTFIIVEISLLFPTLANVVKEPDYANALILAGGNIIFAAMLFLSIYGKKQDPYVDYQDRIAMIKHITKYLVTIIIAANTMTIMKQFFEMDGIVREGITSSIYMLVIALLHLNLVNSIKIEKANFDVYRAPSESIS